MRNLFMGALCLLVLGLWCGPAAARPSGSRAPATSQEPNLTQQSGDDEPQPFGHGLRPHRAGAAAAPERSWTYSGARLLQATTDSVYLLYPNACFDWNNGTWAPQTRPVADSLNTYALNTTGPYQQIDRSMQEKLWHIVDVSTDPAQRPAILAGSRSIWCGKYDPNWVMRVGYPNKTMQILYIDTGTHAASYSLSMAMEISTEFHYDYVHLIGGGGSAADPIPNDKALIENIIDSKHYAGSDLLVSWTGSITTGGTIDVGAPPAGPVYGLSAGSPVPVAVSLTNISAVHRALYLVFVADDLWSTEDGLWPDGRGQVFDLIQTSDNGILYDDQPQPLRPEPPHEPYADARGGEVLVGTDVAPVISARVPSGVGEFWHLAAGSTVPTADYCAPQKQLATDRILSPADATTSLTIPGTLTEVRTCALPLPAGAYRVDIYCSAYPSISDGYLVIDLRWYQDGRWVSWGELSSGVGVGGQLEAWIAGVGVWTAQIWGADSVQARFLLQVPGTANPSTYGVLVDDLEFKVYTGAPTPQFWGGAFPQTTFIDGTMTGLNCSVPPCWPGICGTEVPGGNDDNVNTGATGGGDRFWVSADVGIRANGMGSNWKHGWSSQTGAASTRHLNGAFDPAKDSPRMIYRLFDPTTLTWSPFDSAMLFASVSRAAADTIAGTSFLMDWPPADKLDVDASLPGGFTVNGHSRYAELRYLPRGTRLQYYFKMVNILGGVAYDFGWAGETEELPALPGSSIRAPDIYEFDILPRVYPVGAAGTLLAGRTDTPILNLDSSYLGWGRWGSGTTDPVTQALRALGVRADRYRRTNRAIGGHALGGTDPFLNCWPNMEEYAILDLLANQYRIIIDPANWVGGVQLNEQLSKLMRTWWNTSTGTNGGDRCMFISGDDIYSTIMRLQPNAEMTALMMDVYGVASVIGTWSGGGSNLHPMLDDRFSGGGPGLASPNTFNYPIDGGCPNLRRFDGLTKIGSADAQNAVIFPSGAPDVAGIARMSEMDANADTDRNKALTHAFGIERIRAAGIPPSAANYVHSGVQNRMRMLYKFLTSCRGFRNGESQCWPCPGNASDMTANWAAATGFQTDTYGPLYPIQDNTTATGVEVAEAPRWMNRLEGNYPNPFNPQTTIRFTAAGAGRVTVRVFDVSGRLVTTLAKLVGEGGVHELRWNGKTSDGRPVSSGMYFYRIRFADGEESAAKMMMLK